MKRKIGLLFATLLIALSLPGQVWPGDVNNDGIANHVDVLFLGRFIFFSGPPRSPADQGSEWEEKPLVPWGITFPGTSLDIAFADCDGDGLITPIDIAVIESNYKLTHGTPNPPVPDPGQAGIDPPLFFDDSAIPGPIPEGLPVVLQINFGTPALPVNDFFGIAFSIHYDPTVIKDAFVPISFFEPWLENDFTTIIFNDSGNGVIDIAGTRTNLSPLLFNEGPLASMFFIIEEDVVGLNDPDLPTEFSIEDVILLDDDFNDMPVVNDSLTIIITDYGTPTALNPELESEVKVFPNPVKDALQIQSKALPIDAWEVTNIAGSLLYSEQTPARQQLEISTDTWADGMYVLKLYTSAGTLLRKVVVQH